MDSLDFDFAPLQASAYTVGLGHDPVAEAASVLDSARTEADTIRAMAHAEGLAAGREAAMAELVPAAAALEQAAEAVRADAAAAAARLEAQAVELGIALAAKIVGAAVEADPALVVEAVRGALRGLVERERITVLVNPDDLELVRGAMGGLVSSLGGIEHAEVQAERRVVRGGAVVRTPEGDVDAGIDTKLARAREVVVAALGAGA
jgi:flagellar biosynthesis/type III secretory pathway protein FliH